MTEVNYEARSDQELKRYILNNRKDLEAFHVYMDRRHSRPNRTVVKFDYPAWEEKIVSEIQAQLNSRC